MTSRSTIRLLLLVAVLAVLAACGGASGAGPTGDDVASPVAEQADTATEAPADVEDEVVEPGTTLDACEIVTADDIRAATNADSVAEGEFEASPTTLSPGRSECRYEGDFGGIIVELTPDDGENLYDAAVGAYKDAKIVDGVGDGAFFSADNHRAFAWKGKVTVMFTIFLNGDLDAETVTTELGTVALAKV